MVIRSQKMHHLLQLQSKQHVDWQLCSLCNWGSNKSAWWRWTIYSCCIMVYRGRREGLWSLFSQLGLIAWWGFLLDVVITMTCICFVFVLWFDIIIDARVLQATSGAIHRIAADTIRYMLAPCLSSCSFRIGQLTGHKVLVVGAQVLGVTYREKASAKQDRKS